MDGRSENMRRQCAMVVTTRWVTVLLFIGSWLLLSNHCALGLSETAKPDAESGGCPMHSTPAKKKPATNLLCCKTLCAIAPQALKNVVIVTTLTVAPQDFIGAALGATPRLSLQVHALDTGPPYLRTFAETILQQSILSHAPPASRVSA